MPDCCVLMFHEKISVYTKMRIAWEAMDEAGRKLLDVPLAQQALNLQSCDQAAADGGCWVLSWHFSMLESPEPEMYWRPSRPRQEDPLPVVP